MKIGIAKGMKTKGRPIGELTDARVQQSGPNGQEFTYVDISSINRETKRVEEPKTIPASKAPSRARQVLRAGDVLVSMTRPNLNAVAIVPPDLDGSIGSTGFHVLRAKDSEPGFLYYAVQTPAFIDAMCQKVQGALYPAVRPRDISSFILPPFSLAAQRAAVAEIEKQFTRLEAGVAALRRVQASLKRYRAAILKAACEGRLVPTEAMLAKAENRKFETGKELLARILAERRRNWRGRGKYKEPATADTANLPSLPKGWTWASLEQITWASSYGTSAKCSPDNSGPPVLRIPNIADGRIDLTDLKFAGPKETIDTGNELAPGDLLIIRTNGSKNLIGRSAVVREKLGSATSYASYLIRFRLYGSPALFDWVGTIWNVSFLRAWVEQRAATSAGQHNISMTVLSTMPIPLSPLAEQVRIVAEIERRLSVVEELDAVVSSNLKRSTLLKQSILSRAFAGEI